MITLEEILKKYQENQKVNFDAELLDVIKDWKTQGKRPRVILHSCCAPCSTYVLEEMTKYADVTIFFSNSNIHPKEEYQRRALVQEKFINDFNQATNQQVIFIEDEYKPKDFIKQVLDNNLQHEDEGGARCTGCFQMRLDRVAHYAYEHGYDYFGSALTLSPHKNAQVINKLGFEVQTLYNINYLPSDFKKRGGYKRSVEMCETYDVYRQCYCGCAFAAVKQDIDLKQVKCEAIDAIKDIFKKEVL